MLEGGTQRRSRASSSSFAIQGYADSDMHLLSRTDQTITAHCPERLLHCLSLTFLSVYSCGYLTREANPLPPSRSSLSRLTLRKAYMTYG